MKNNKNSARGFIALGLLLAATSVLAEPGSVNDFFVATQGTDASVSILEKVIGVNRLKSPFTAGAPEGALGNMFLVLNVFVFIVGIFFAAYGLGAGIVQTAHEGQVLGRRMSAVWMPIRMVTGIAGLMPVFGGFSLSQAIMMLASFLGIGLANYSWTATLDGAGQGFSGIVAPSVGTATAGSSPKHLAYALFTAKVCQLAYAEQEAANSTHRNNTLVRYSRAFSAKENSTYFAGWGKVNAGVYSPTCGRIEIGPKQKAALMSVEGMTNAANGAVNAVGQSLADLIGTGGVVGATPRPGGYSINSVNYQGVANSVAAAGPVKARDLEATINGLAEGWYLRWKASLLAPASGGSGDSTTNKLPKNEIEAAASAYIVAVQTAGKTATGDGNAVTSAAINNMKAFGWFGAGSWYSTLAQAQTALGDAMKNLDIHVVPALGADVAQSERVRDALAAYTKAYDAAYSELDDKDPWASAFDTGFNMTNQTGNRSIGQRIAVELLDAMSSNSGGGGQMNPIVTIKNIGDYLMTSTEAVLVGKAFVDSFGDDDERSSQEGLMSEEKKNKKSFVGNLVNSGVGFVMGMLSAIFVVGAIFSIYIPFIPFIQWMGGLIQYVSIFFEGLLGAPIWAFAHLDADGEGMGQRTERGYLFLLNMMFRPFLMIFGFVLAAALLPLLGTFQAVMFVPAMANVQGDSVTGMASILFLLAVFGMLNVTMIHGLFNLITIIPDQILGWVGNIAGQTIGKDTDDKAHNLFVRVGGASSGAMVAGASRK